MVTVEGFVADSYEDSGTLVFELLDSPDDFAIVALVVYAKGKPNLQDGMRVRITGPCSRRGSLDNMRPAVWVDRIEVR